MDLFQYHQKNERNIVQCCCNPKIQYILIWYTFSVYINLNRHEFILFGTNLCHFGVNQYQSGMESYHQTMESGVKNVSKKFSEPLDDGMWNIFFNICIISWAVAKKVWKSLFVSSNLVWIYTRMVWIHSSLVWIHAYHPVV